MALAEPALLKWKAYVYHYTNTILTEQPLLKFIGLCYIIQAMLLFSVVYTCFQQTHFVRSFIVLW